MRFSFFALLVAPALSPVCGDDPPADVGRAELKKLSGTWLPEKAVFNGREHAAAERRQRTWVFESEEVRSTFKGEVDSRGTIRVRPGEKPAQFDLKYTEGNGKGLTEQGIYKLDGDTLTVCTGSPRPTEFRSEPDSQRTLIVFKRKK